MYNRILLYFNLIGCTSSVDTYPEPSVSTTSDIKIEEQSTVNTAPLWSHLQSEFNNTSELSLVWYSDELDSIQYLLPLSVVQKNTRLHQKYYSFENQSVTITFTDLGQPRTIRSYNRHLSFLWKPEQLRQFTKIIDDGPTFLIFPRNSPAPPSAISIDNRTIQCLETTNVGDVNIVQCTLINEQHLAKQIDVEDVKTYPEPTNSNPSIDALSSQIDKLTMEIHTLNQSLNLLNISNRYYQSLSTHPSQESAPNRFRVSTPIVSLDRVVEKEKESLVQSTKQQALLEGNKERHIAKPDVSLAMYLSNDFAYSGETLDLFFNSPSDKVNIHFYKCTATGTELMHTIRNVSTIRQKDSSDGWLGAGWQSSVSFTIPENWDSDLYIVQVQIPNTKQRFNSALTIFNPTNEHNDILVLEPNLTRYAYSNWGGKSMYGFNSSDSKNSDSVSSLRPIGGFQKELLKFDRWIEDEGYSVDYITMTEFDNPDFPLHEYSNIVVVGHNEYWSIESKDRFAKFVEDGGNGIILSGNTLWWETESDGALHTVYKEVPEENYDDLHFGMDEIFETIGVNFDLAGYITEMTPEMIQNGNYGFVVADQKHWVFQKTGLKKGETFGSEQQIAGYEVDGADVKWHLNEENSVVISEVPDNLNLLAYALSRRPNDEMGLGTVIMYRPSSTSGCIFNAATIQWTNGLWDLKNKQKLYGPVHKITKNVFNRFSSQDIDCLQ